MLEIGVGFGLGLLVLMMSQVLINYHRFLQAWTFVALLIGVAAFLLLPIAAKAHSWWLVIIQTTIPAIFWLNCQLAFKDSIKLRDETLLIALFAFYTVFGPALYFSFDLYSARTWLLDYPQISEYLVILFGFITIVQNWSSDLVETRRMMRGWTMVIIGAAIMFIVAGLQFDLGDRIYLIWTANVTILMTATMLLRARTEQLSEPVEVGGVQELENSGNLENLESSQLQSKSLNTEIDVVDPHLEKLQRLMSAGYYHNDGLTIAKLAKDIDLPEYRTRQLINRKLGYKNFNDYIHQLRIAEAAQLLLEDLDVPILNISLDVGYRTLSSFNRAFKDIQGMSPTEFRLQSQDPSSM